MDTFHGQCLYWYHIMDKLGVISELYHAKWLSRSGSAALPIEYYQGLVDDYLQNVKY